MNTEQKDASGAPLGIIHCPVCGYKMDSATSISEEDERPRPGDFSLCLKCGELLRFREAMKIESAGLNDVLDLKKNTENWVLVERAQRLIRQQRLIP